MAKASTEKAPPSDAEDKRRATRKSQPICGLIMPITAAPPYDPNHWQDVRNVLDRAVEQAGFQPQPVWEGGDADIIQDRIVTNLYENPMVVCDVSGLNPNVMVELGMRLSFGKPLVIVTDDVKKLPFDTSMIEHVPYPADLHLIKTEAFIALLTAKIEQVAKRADEGTYKPYVKNFGPVELGGLGSEERTVDQYLMQRIDSLAADVRALRQSARHETSYPSGFVSLFPERSVPISITNSPGTTSYVVTIRDSVFEPKKISEILMSFDGIIAIHSRWAGSYVVSFDKAPTIARLAELEEAFRSVGMRVDIKPTD